MFRFALLWAPRALDFWIYAAVLFVALLLMAQPWRTGLWRRVVLCAWAAVLLVAGATFAFAADASATSVPVAPLLGVVAPYAVALLPFVIGWGVAEFRKFTGVQFSQGAVDKLDTLAKAEAGALIAASPTNLAGVAVPVGSSMIAAAANRILSAAPTILDDTGLTPDAVAAMVAGHLGAMQAQQASAPAPKP